MKKFWGKIKKLKWWIIGCIVFLVAVQILYTIPAPCEWLEAKYEAGDLISFVGTIVLGIVAIVQTKEANEQAETANKQAKVANDMSNRLMELEENRYKLETRPFVMLKDWNGSFENYYNIINCHEKLYIQSTKFELKNGATAFCVSLDLLNTTQAYVSVQVNNLEYVDGNKSVFDGLSYANTVNISLRLNPGESGSIVFWGDTQILKDALSHGKIRFSFILENRFGERYQESFDAVIVIMAPLREEDEPFVVFSASNYRIGKFVKGPEGKPTLEWEDTNNGQA